MLVKEPNLRTPSAENVAPSARRRPSRWPRVIVSLGAIAILMMWILGVFHRGRISGVKQPVPQRSVQGAATYTLIARAMPASIEAVGTVQAEQIATVTARVTAAIMEIRVSAGQRVAKGETLVVLDNRDLRHRLEQAQEAARGAEAALEQARSDYNRDKPLYDQQVITPYDFEHAQTNLKVAEANLHRLRQAQREAEVNLSYAVIRSPFDGVVIDKQVNVGDLASPGKPLFTMYQQARLWLEANVPEEDLARIRLSAPMSVHVDALERNLPGRVVEIVPSSDPVSRTGIVRVRLSAPEGLVPGMFGRLAIPLPSEPALTLPRSALIRVGQLTLVDVVHDGQVERRAVQIGRTFGDQYEVLSGLVSGETIVLQGSVPVPSS